MPKILEGKIIPVVLFIGFLDLLGTTGAVLAALVWSLSVIAYRLATGGRISGLVVLTTIGLLVKTILAVATGSVVVYFLQPTLTTALVGLAFLFSVPLNRPLAARLALDFCPFDARTAEHPLLGKFFTRLSLLWAFTSMVNAGFTLWLLFTQEIRTFVLIKAFTGPSFTAVTFLIAGLWFRHQLKQSGLQLRFAKTLSVSSA